MLVQSLVGLLSASLALATHSTLNVWLRSSWEAPPLILEVLESAANEDPSIYFPLLSSLSVLFPSLAQQNVQQQLESIIDLIQQTPTLAQSHPKWDLSSFQASLAMHATTPKIQAYYQYYNTVINRTDAGSTTGQICESWVEWRGKGFCDFAELKQDMELSLTEADSKSVPISLETRILPFDHIFPSEYLPTAYPPAILYLAGLSKPEGDLLAYLRKHAAQDENFRFVVRYRPSLAPDGDPALGRNSLKGYGVEMVLKRTDYLTVDDRETDVGNDQQEVYVLSNNTVTNKRNRYAGIFGDDPWADLAANPLRPSEITDLGLKASSLILRDSEPLEALIHIAQDFPKLAAGLARKVSINSSMAQDVAINQQSMRMGNMAWINGRFVGPLEANAHSLLDLIREERHRALSLCTLGLTPNQVFRLLSDETIGEAMFQADPLDSLVDASDRQEGGKVIQWWNNIEKDKRYVAWPDSMSAILTPSRPGGFQPVRKNIWNTILVLDLSTRTGLATIGQTVSNYIRRGFPFRFGVVPWVDDTTSSSNAIMARLITHMVKTQGRGQTTDFIMNLLQNSQKSTIDLQQVEKLYDSSYITVEGSTGQRFRDIIQAPEGLEYINKVQQWLKRLAVDDSSTTGHFFLNGQYRPMSDMWLQQAMEDYSTQLSYLQRPVIAKQVRKTKDVSNFFYDLPSTSRRRNVHIIPGTASNKLRVFDNYDVFPHNTPLLKHFLYPNKPTQGESLLSTMVFADFDSVEGRQLSRDILRYLVENPDSQIRLGFQHVPSNQSSYSTPFRMSTLLYHLYTTNELSLVRPQDLLLLEEVLARETGADETEGSTETIISALPSDSPLQSWLSLEDDPVSRAAARQFWAALADGHRKMGIEPGSPYLLVNGRLIGPLEQDAFTLLDFAALERYELNTRARPVRRALDALYHDTGALEGVVMDNMIHGITAAIGAAYTGHTEASDPRTSVYTLLRGGSSSFEIGEQQTALVHVYAIIDPLSESAQKLGPLLKMVADLDHTFVHVQLNPKLELEELPLKRFYRYALETKPTFNIEGSFAATDASFVDLPSDPIFTLGMDVPHSWLVAPRKSIHDLDNLRLDAILGRQESPVVDLTFELEQLVIDGHAREGDKLSPPRGLQLQLSALDGEPIGDTMVMANAGYVQFKANPGVMALSIRDARGQQVYTLNSVSSASFNPGHNVHDSSAVYLTSFSGTTLFPTFSRKLGMEEADVLDFTSAQSESGFFGKVVTSLSTILGRKPVPSQKQADINIFTVASGMLYERFASIMILSVLKHTDSTVKFWFIKNFLSPSFLNMVSSKQGNKLGQSLGAQGVSRSTRYELVTYKWPSWLRSQKEKQREIWGLDKIIFVDADQIVRTDLKELVDLDLQGRVYGYAPMGDDREEMEGFRFWKTGRLPESDIQMSEADPSLQQGYWRDSLRGRPYHISALYVVDLKRFRQDRLRAQYQALSADPNSLANLDQDLPNAMQDVLPIYTLDRSWLWCETWCSQESLKDAKTIDLCQNPLTKEPKLDRARKIPEWEAYDNEVAAFTRRIATERLDNDESGDSMIAVADVEALATPDKVVPAPGQDTLKGDTHSITEVEDTMTESTMQHAETAAEFDEKHDAQHRIPDEL
ncbi:hypothetical protein QFC21_001681 [Naganishia friedmannii]|uniref:Uncharacterized protein n=1 Tax=Naganishia friedmannii TaxID=89922 RepID=A0ACC2W1K5_9TREE|nr:hypothetical protein QFC21_001681 [Naganishia friedmannii]